MSDDHREEQEMEAEALTAIFEDSLEVISPTQPFEWAISLWPEPHDDGGGVENHVGIKVLAKVPLDYPELSRPELKVEILRGLTEEHAEELLTMAREEAEANAGMPAMYAICERLREWLIENNVKGMDDMSMYAQMLKREKEKEREELKAQKTYEAQKQKEELTEAESEDLTVRRRRAEGTPCTDETFYAWRDRFDAEQEAARKEADAADLAEAKRKKGGVPTNAAADAKKTVDKSGRLTGFQQFSDKMGTLNLEAMEAAAENAQVDEDEEEDNIEDVDEDLFDDEDDLDDLDFDDDDDDDGDDADGDEPNI